MNREEKRKEERKKEKSHKNLMKSAKSKGKVVPIHTMKENRGSSNIAPLKLGARWR